MAVDQNSGKVEEPVQSNTEDYEHLLDDYSHFVPPAEGEILEGRVLTVTGQEVIIDFGYKSEGLVPIEQFRSPGGEIQVHPGDVVDVMIDHGEEVEGYILLSHEKAARLRVWENLEMASQEQLIISGRVLGRVLAHELYHAVRGTVHHGASGLAKGFQSTVDLKSDEIAFDGGDWELQPAPAQ